MAGQTLALRCGPPWPPISGTELPGCWPKWQLTSSGVAHHVIPPAPFPPPTLQVRGPLGSSPRGAWKSRLLCLEEEGPKVQTPC